MKSFEPTYEELKQVVETTADEAGLYVLSLPMRN